MSFLLPQTHPAIVLAVRPLEVHGDRYVDLLLQLDDPDAPPLGGRIGASECPAKLAQGERVLVRVTLGVITALSREPTPS